MGTKIGRIEQEFILNNLVDKSIPVELQFGKKRVTGVIISLDDSAVVFSSSDSQLNSLHVEDTVTFFFSFYSNTMTFTAKVTQEGNPLKLKTTSGVYKNLKRKFVRVRADQRDDISMTFTLKNASVVLDFPRTKEYESFDSVVFTDDFNYDNIQLLIKDFKEKAAKISSESKIIMFRARKPETFEEKLITETGKCLYIPDTALGRLVTIKSEIAELIVLPSMFLDRTGVEKEFLGKTLRQVDHEIREKYEGGINAEIYCPIIYHEYVVGYIYLVNLKNRLVKFSEKDLLFCKEFSRVIAYVLDRNGYFSEKKTVESEFKPRIVDISASGLLFTHQEKKLSELLGLYGDIKLSLKVGSRRLSILSRVMRKYEYRGQYFYGLQFLEIEPEDFRFLFEYVYGRPFSDEDDRLWEGGAKPPELDL